MSWRSNFERCIQLLPKRYVRQSLHPAIDRLDVPVGSSAAVASRLMAQLVYPQLRKYPRVRHLSFVPQRNISCDACQS
jgi:hypothetical protein